MRLIPSALTTALSYHYLRAQPSLIMQHPQAYYASPYHAYGGVPIGWAAAAPPAPPGPGYGEAAKKRRTRSNFSWQQLSVLEKVFETDPLPRQALLLELANSLELAPRVVQVWFQNRRQKWKATHHAAGQTPPELRNTSSRMTTLETLLPDLAPTENGEAAVGEGSDAASSVSIRLLPPFPPPSALPRSSPRGLSRQLWRCTCTFAILSSFPRPPACPTQPDCPPYSRCAVAGGARADHERRTSARAPPPFASRGTLVPWDKKTNTLLSTPRTLQ